jgi:hypothetical protein
MNQIGGILPSCGGANCISNLHKKFPRVAQGCTTLRNLVQLSGNLVAIYVPLTGNLYVPS